MSSLDPAIAERKAAVSDYKRSLIRDAAKGVFAEHGIDGASLRAIAKAAGYTTGAIYVHFATKEELYADVLRESLHALVTELEAARGTPGAVLRTLLDFYRERPQDFDLSFYLFGGTRPVGLNPELDRELNARMSEIVELVGEGLGSPAQARHAGTAATSYVFGLLLMLRTGRLRILGQDADALLDTYISTLEAGSDAPA
jgi:AcrR family transcriptional regulator